MACAALLEWAQIRSLSVWAVNIVAFLPALRAADGSPNGPKQGIICGSVLRAVRRVGDTRRGVTW